MQYNENDWDFLVRICKDMGIPMASHLNEIVMGNVRIILQSCRGDRTAAGYGAALADHDDRVHVFGGVPLAGVVLNPRRESGRTQRQADGQGQGSRGWAAEVRALRLEHRILGAR